MKAQMKKVLSYILAMAMILAVFPLPNAIASEPVDPSITLGSATLSGGKFYYDNAWVTGQNIRTILISFSDSVTSGDAIILPATPAGFAVSASSASNNYTKRINLDSGVAASDVQAYIRSVGFTLASQTQTVQITVSTEIVDLDTFYNRATEHYYQFVSDISSNWLQAYDAAKAATYRGRSGYLATVTSLDEDIFINSLSGGKTGWLGGTILTNTGTSGGSLYYDGFNTESVVPNGWYWACGPEKGITYYNVNTLLILEGDEAAHAEEIDALNTTRYYNWARIITAYEPNNSTEIGESSWDSYETCLTTLVVDGRVAKHGALFSWNDIRYDHVGPDEYGAKGYFIEYGDQITGDSSGDSPVYASDSGTLEKTYTATVNTRINGTLSAAPGTVELKQSSTTMYTLSSGGTGVYTASIINGTYDVFINNEDTGKDITINNGNGSATVYYYTVSFAISNAGTASGSTVSATASGTSITSGAAVLSGKEIVITAAGAGATTYTYAWSGTGTSGQTTASITIPSLSGTVNALCTVTGTTVLPTWAADIWTNVDGAYATSPGTIELRQGGTTVYTAAASGTTGRYTVQAVNGTYDIFINGEDTGESIIIGGTAAGVQVDYFTVSFAAADAGTASGSTVSATAGGTSITSGAAVLSGKEIVITAAGAGATTYTYAWSGTGTSGQTTTAITIPSLSGTVNALCTVTGTTVLPTWAADIWTNVDGAYATSPGTIELRQGGTTVYTAAASGTTGRYTVQAVNGTYDIFINGEDTGESIIIGGTAAGVQVDYCTVSFAAANAGTASGSTVSATAGGTAITSGTAVLLGKPVAITAAGAGADSYAYLWSGTGTSGETTAVINIPALSSTVDALCTVTGTTIQPTYAANILTYLDNLPAAAPGAVELWQNGTIVYTANAIDTGSYTASTVNGTYDIYINNEDSGLNIIINGEDANVYVDYYTVSFAAAIAGTAYGSTISATAGGATITTGAAVLSGKAVTITAQGAGADSYAYLWSGLGTSGETAAAITIPSLSTPINALCTVTGTTAPVTGAAIVYTYQDGAPAAVPGNVQLKQGGTTMYMLSTGAAGVYTALTAYGTYDVYINNEDTGEAVTVSASSGSAEVYYFTVSFAGANAGTASGSTVSAIAGGSPIASGTAVLSGKAVSITATGAGTDNYTYLWSGLGTSGETAAAITIPSLSTPINALCTVTGTTAPVTGAAIVYTYQDGAPAAVPGNVQLKQGGTTMYTLSTGAAGVYTALTAYGTYDVFVNNEDTGEDVTVSASSGTAEVYYFTVSFAVANAGTASGSTVSATAGGSPIASGTAVLKGKAVSITATGAGTDNYTYLWSGQGTGSETASSLTISSLGGTVNALCTVTGAANVYAPGTLEEEADDFTIVADGLFSQDARLYILPIPEGETNRAALEALQSGKQTAAAFEVYMEPANAFKPPLTLRFGLGERLNGKTVYILHRLHNGDVEHFTVTVENGEAIITVQELSPFLLSLDPPVTITAQLQNAAIVTGQTATFWVTASGAGPLSYQWQKKTGINASWEDIPGAVGAQYTTSQANLGNNGYQYRVIITDVYGRSVTSSAATLTVTQAPISPATGDSSQPLLNAVLMMLFTLGLILLLRKRKAA